MSLFWHQLRAEQLTMWRSREAVIFVFLFPPLLFVLLASVFGDGIEDGRRVSSYLVAGLIGYAVANTALGGLAITLVIRRESGLLKRLRSTPLPGSVYLVGVLASNLLIVVLQSLTVIGLGVLLFDADLPERALSFILVLATYVDGNPIWDHLGAVGVMAAWGAGGYLVARARFGWEPRER